MHFLTLFLNTHFSNHKYINLIFFAHQLIYLIFLLKPLFLMYLQAVTFIIINFFIYFLIHLIII